MLINPYVFSDQIATYISRVEVIDGQSLESGVKDAINVFITGCRSDGILGSIKTACILAGARTLNGALVPLVGIAPTNNGFLTGDYNRKTGLAGNASTKYLGSNRAGNADPQNNTHAAVYVGVGDGSAGRAYIGTSNNSSGSTNLGKNTISSLFFRCQSAAFVDVAAPSALTGLIGVSRSSASAFTYRRNGANGSFSTASETPNSTNYGIFALGNGTAPTSARISFYSIGESLDLALLDARVTTLINSIAAAIP